MLYFINNENNITLDYQENQYGSATNITDSRNYNNQSKLFANKEFKNISIDLDTIIQDSKEILVLDKSSL